jgi:uncharacterized SAM-binding protein YcdF (DUF218 family)
MFAPLVVLLGVVLIVFWFAATPLIAKWLDWRLASQVPGLKLEILPLSDAVILLGGGSYKRIVHAEQVYLAGKAPRIVVTGGSADRLVELGVPHSALILETESRTTRENAVNTTAIFKAHGWRTGLLVTSAGHMPRAFAAFQKLGLEVVPAATHIYGGPPQHDSLLDLLPDADALAWTKSTIKEIIGIRIYRHRGWA